MHAPEQPSLSPLRFFLLTFLLSWVIWIPLVLVHFHIGPLRISEDLISIIRLFGVLMPMVSALVLSAHRGGRPAVRTLLSRLKIWRVQWRWWAAVILIYPVLLILAGLIFNSLSNESPIQILPLTAVSLLANIIFLTIAGLGEEIGWRGVALPSLLQRYGPLSASMILGVVWATWHLPFWLLLDVFSQYGAGYFVLDYLFIIPTTFYITWFFINSRQSLLLPVVFHVVFNIVNVAIFPVTGTTLSFAVFVGLQFLLTIVVILRLRKK